MSGHGAAAAAATVPLSNEELTQMRGALTDRVRLHERETLQLKKNLDETDSEIVHITDLLRNVEEESGTATIEKGKLQGRYCQARQPQGPSHGQRAGNAREDRHTP